MDLKNEANPARPHRTDVVKTVSQKRDKLDEIIQKINSIILGKDTEVRLILSCMLASGHLLIEDIPGVGKTTLAQTLAKVMGLEYNRVQCTSDLLPADIIGTSVYNKNTNEFHFHQGPLFNNMVLVDELNRATPRTQSSLLEAMEEQQVSVDSRTYSLPDPFFVIATQNQRFHIGTFPLPESQLDRFLMRIQLGYPDTASERNILIGESRHNMIKKIAPLMDKSDITVLQNENANIHLSDPILNYIQHIINESRSNPDKYRGLSPRAGIALVKASRSWTLLHGREYVLPEDVQAVAGPVLEHRLAPESSNMGGTSYPKVKDLLRSIPLQR